MYDNCIDIVQWLTLDEHQEHPAVLIQSPQVR